MAVDTKTHKNIREVNQMKFSCNFHHNQHIPNNAAIQQIAPTHSSGTLLTVLRTVIPTWLLLEASLKALELWREVKVPGKTTYPARRSQVNKLTRTL
jgi:hypothetical protein